MLLRKEILKFVRPSLNYILNCNSPNGIKLIARLRFGFSHQTKHKFRQNSHITLNPVCSSGDDKGTTIYNLLHCPYYLQERRKLLHNFQSIGENIKH